MRHFIAMSLVLLLGAGLQPAAAQAVDPRVTQLEEQVRALNGRVEDMTFQILQLEDQVRRMQEDFEFRFQELEKGAGGATTPAASDDRTSVEPPADGAPAQETAAAATPAETQAAPADAAGQQAASEPVLPQDGKRVRIITTEKTASVSPDPATGPAATGTAGSAAPVDAPPATDTAAAPAGDLGNLRFDELGRIVGAEPAPDAPVSGPETASLPAGADSESLYNAGYERVLSGDYAGAEAIFRQQLQAFPDDALAADARYWLGETLLAQKRYDEAADAFIEAHNVDPNARKAPETLMKLGVTMASLGNRDIACATFAEAAARYPNASPNVLQRLETERAAARC